MEKCALHHLTGWRSCFTDGLIGVVGWSLLAGAGSEVLAAGSTLSNGFRLWAPVFLPTPISQSCIGFAEVNPRLGGDFSDLNQLILRTALGYKLNDQWSTWQGYAWNTVYDNAANQDAFTGERRVYQQLTFKDQYRFLEVFPITKIQSRFQGGRTMDRPYGWHRLLPENDVTRGCPVAAGFRQRLRDVR